MATPYLLACLLLPVQTQRYWLEEEDSLAAGDAGEGLQLVVRKGAPFGLVRSCGTEDCPAPEIEIFTDLVAGTRDPVLAKVRENAFDMGCWNASFTPDLCCTNGGWDVCWGGPFSFESCCGGWTSTRADKAVFTARKAYHDAIGALTMARQQDLEEPHEFYIHALVLGSLASQIEQGTKLLMAEVGVFEGTFMKHVLRMIGPLVQRYLLVDLWGETQAGQSGGGLPGGLSHFYATVSSAEEFWNVTRFIQERSDLAARLVEDGSMDVVFVDASHSYEDARADIEAWWPKVRPGGILAGHDYSPQKPGRFPGVILAVEGFIQRNGLESHIMGLPGTSFAILKPP